MEPNAYLTGFLDRRGKKNFQFEIKKSQLLISKSKYFQFHCPPMCLTVSYTSACKRIKWAAATINHLMLREDKKYL